MCCHLIFPAEERLITRFTDGETGVGKEEGPVQLHKAKKSHGRDLKPAIRLQTPGSPPAHLQPRPTFQQGTYLTGQHHSECSSGALCPAGKVWDLLCLSGLSLLSWDPTVRRGTSDKSPPFVSFAPPSHPSQVLEFPDCQTRSAVVVSAHAVLTRYQRLGA